MHAHSHRTYRTGQRPRRGMGDVGGDPVVELVAQINRFGPGAPVGLQFVQAPLPLASGKVTPEIALPALAIYQRRATDAWNQFHDEGSAAAISAANAGFVDPVAFVTGRLAEVTQTIAGFADASGLPPAAGEAPGVSTLLVVAGVGLALWWMLRGP